MDDVFTKRLKLMMKARQTTQGALAREIGVQRQTVSLYMLGRSRPDTDRLISIAKALGTTPNYLLGFTDNPNQKGANSVIKLDIKPYCEECPNFSARVSRATVAIFNRPEVLGYADRADTTIFCEHSEMCARIARIVRKDGVGNA